MDMNRPEYYRGFPYSLPQLISMFVRFIDYVIFYVRLEFT